MVNPDSPEWDPSVHRRRLQRYLRAARDRSGFTQHKVAAKMDWSPSKVIRIEAGTVAVTPNDLRALFDLYAITDPTEVEQMVQSARLARGKSPLDPYKPYLSPAFTSYLGYESSASSLRNFEPIYVPGLLQTREYAEAAFQLARGPKSDARIDALLRLRFDRQRRLLDKADLELAFMIDESVIRRTVGTAAIMRGQLARLLDLAETPNVTLHVIPFSVGVYRSMQVPFVVLEFSEAAMQWPILFREYPERDDIIVEDDGDTTAEPADDDSDIAAEPADATRPISPGSYRDLFMDLATTAPPEDSRRLIKAAIKGFAD